MSEIHPIRFPEGVASADSDVAFIERRSGGISAIDLRSGVDLWTTDVAGRPVLAIDDRLIVEDRTESHDNVLQFVVLDLTRRGATDRQLDPIVLPDWVSVADPDQRFDYEAWAENRSLVIDWSAESHYAGGAAPPPSVIAEAQRSGGGRVRVDLETGRIQRDALTATAATPPTMALSPDVARLLPSGAHAAAVVGDRVFFLEPSRQSGEGPKLVSLDLQTGNRLWERTLPSSPRPRARRM